MKTALSLVVLLAVTTLAFGQGKLAFNIDINNLIYLTTNTGRLLGTDATKTADWGVGGGPLPLPGSTLYTDAGGTIAALTGSPTFVVALFGGTSSNSLSLQTTTTIDNMYHGNPGGILGCNVNFANLPAGTRAWFQVQVYDSRDADADASMYAEHYYGKSQIFRATPQAAVFAPIYQTQSPVNSTWTPGTFEPTDIVANLGAGSGYYGGISVQAGSVPWIFISSQPSSQTVWVGSTTSFSITAEGKPDGGTLSYQWRFDGTNLPGATDTIYTRSNAQLADAGTYTVVMTNSYGSKTSSDSVLQVLPFGAPSIRVNNQLAVGTVPAVLSAQLTISGGFTNGFIFYTLDGTTPTTSSRFYAGPVTLTNTAIVHAMSLSADFTQTAFAPAITVQIIPVYNLQTSIVGSGAISVNPTNAPYASNTVVVLTANAAVAWAFDHWTGDVTGSQNPMSLTMNAPHSVQAVFAQTAYPLTATTPGGGTVSVNGQVIAPATLFPIGSLVTLTVVASNGWSFLGYQGNASGTNNPLSLTMNQTNNVQGVFGTVVGTNTAGGGGIVLNLPNPIPYGTTIRASAVPNNGNYLLTWSGAASGTNSPTGVSVTTAIPTVSALFSTLPGGKYSLAVVVMGNGAVAISPQKSYYSPGDSVTLSASTTNAGTQFYGWTGDASGTNNPLVVVVSTNKIIQANFGELPTVNISPQNLIVLAGSNAVLNANAAGFQPMSYQWLKSSAPLDGATNASYAITNAQATNSDNYSVIVSNAYGSATSGVATVTVVFPPSITHQPQSWTAAAGVVLNLSVSAAGTEPLSYQWLNSSGNIVGATNATYTLDPVQTNNAGSYSVVVANPYGVATSDVATLTVYVPVSITTQPASQVVPAYSTVLFSVIAGGYPAPSYQWAFNGTNLPGATSRTLTITNVLLPNLGDYAVMVGNGYSSRLSDPATLSMLPSITSPFIGATTIWGRSVVLSVGAVGSGELAYQWYKDGLAVAGATDATLNFTSIQATNGGLYSVVVSSPFGSITNVAAQVVVNPAGVSLGFSPTLTINGVVGYSYLIQSSTNLANTNAWVTLTNLTLSQPVELWVDTSVDASSPFYSRYYYRVLPGQ